MHRRFLWLAALPLILLAEPALAQSVSVNLGEGSLTGRMVQLIILLTVLSIAPGILMTVTSFTRIVVVLSLLRNALGTQQSPPNAVLISLALFLSFFIMGPTFERAWQDGIQPLTQEQITEEEAFDRTAAPFRAFMLQHTRENDLKLFVDLSRRPVETVEQTPLTVLIPAFMISELRRAFEIGFLLFLPFLIIDLVVSSILMSMGMMMLPPATISLPFKLIFFVLVDGWHLVAGSLVQSYGT
ncbi:flagellar type III secretion system pore protein FliP [Pedomonas mirosovicensis]|uniref:flagellar type III secretion system pore protein FliP n=1 Tax=Pedomonas mirosovicensis TaxID=2908641 RepID=UPI00286FAB40|nr:flagellar type III secretion system pore protein FliP [Pedomonas mirosovicensis]